MAAVAEQDWRLEAQVRRAGPGRKPGHHGLDSGVVDDLRAAVGDEIVLTRDGSVLFAYGATHQNVDSAREQILGAFGREGLQASVSVSHWDRDLDDWRVVDPPPSTAVGAAISRGAGEIVTRTFVCVAGRLVRSQVEQTMLESAGIHGIECRIAEHSRLLTTQVSFTVTGPEHKLDAFRQDLRDAAFATIRADALTMNPAV